MPTSYWLRLLAAAFVWAAFFAAPGLPLPGADRLGFTGAAAAQETIDIDTFYDELDPYGEWVWHPRYGYVWLPEDVSPRWRPYTVGRWTYTDEYGWYWDSNEPFAWAVYHYGRWGYDEDYGWFWVPGDTWAPAWVQWRYSDDYVGWAPVGPGRRGYAYGVPVNYEPPIAKSWVFVQPRYMTSRAISHYALPIGGLGVAFFGATNVYRPIYRGGIVYNYGMPRDRVVKIIRRPIYVQKVYKVDNWKGGKFDRDGRNKGIKIYAPNFNRDGRNRGPKKFVDNPKDFKPKAKLHDTFKGDVPKGWGKSAKGLTPIAKEDPDGFKKKKGRFDGHDQDFGDRGKDKDRDKDRDRDNDKDQAKGTPPPINKVIRDQDGGQGGTVGDTGDQGDRDGRGQGQRQEAKVRRRRTSTATASRAARVRTATPPPPPAPPPIVKGVTGEPTTGKVGATDDRGDSDDRDKDKDKTKGPISSSRATAMTIRAAAERRTFGAQAGRPRPVQAGQARRRSGRRWRRPAEAEDLRRSWRSGRRRPRLQARSAGGGKADSVPKATKVAVAAAATKKDKCQKHPESPECPARTSIDTQRPR